MKVKSEREVAKSCLTLSDPMDYSLLGSSVHGIFQASATAFFSRKLVLDKGFEMAILISSRASLVSQLVKNPSAMQETQIWFLAGEDLIPTSVFLPGKSHGQRSLVGCSPWGC